MCTGQKPNTDLLKQLSPSSIDPATNLAKVTRSMQLASLKEHLGEEQTEAEAKAAASTNAAAIDLRKSIPESYSNLAPSSYPHIYVI